MSAKALSSIQSINITVDHPRKQQHWSIENLESFDYASNSTTSWSLWWSCAQQRALRSLEVRHFPSQGPKLCTNQVPSLSTQKQRRLSRDSKCGQTAFQLYIVDMHVSYEFTHYSQLNVALRLSKQNSVLPVSGSLVMTLCTCIKLNAH